MDPTPLLPYLIGLIPIFLARSWQARMVAVLFGVVSLGLGVYYIWSIHHSPDVLSGIQMIGPAVVGALCVSAISLVVTYFVDKKYIPKA
jgi:peptidoglycan/LPS O-acetylase OafA/YrhL